MRYRRAGTCRRETRPRTRRRRRRALQGDFPGGDGVRISRPEGGWLRSGRGPSPPRPFYGQAPPPARLGLHSALYACPPRERLPVDEPAVKGGGVVEREVPQRGEPRRAGATVRLAFSL